MPASKWQNSIEDDGVMKLSRLILALMLLALLVYASLAFFVRPMADDYCLMGECYYKGPVQAVADIYFNWSGRYTTYFIVGLQGVLGNGSLIVFPILLIAAFCLSWYTLIYQLAAFLKLKNPRELALYAGVFIGLAYVDSASAEPILWPSAITSYALPSLVILNHLTSFIIIHKHGLQGSKLFLLSFFWGFILLLAAGFSETYIGFHGLCLGFGWLFSLLFLRGDARKRSLIFLTISLLLLVIGALIVFTAPGNEVRVTSTLTAEQISITGNLNFILWNLSVYPLIDRYGTAIDILVFVLTVFFLLWWYRDDAEAFLETGLEKLANRKVFWLSFFIFLLINSITMILPVLGTGYLVSRTWIIPRTLQFCMAIFWGLLVKAQIMKRGGIKRFRQKKLLAMTQTVILLFLVAYPIILVARNASLIPEFAKFAQEWDARDAYIRELATTENIIRLPELEHNMEDYLNLGIAEVEATWVNDCMATYYNVDAYEVIEEAGN
jgi:hypothetical protein